MARLAFLGSPPFAAATLSALVGAGHDVVGVVTRADRRRSRRGEPEPTAVGALAEELGIAVTHDVRAVAGFGAELGVVVAFGRLVPPETLAALAMVNLHLSLLPRWRGAAPVERAILAGDAETGVCLMALEEGLDTGPVYARVAVPIGAVETAEELTWRLGALGTTALLDRLRDGVGGLGRPEPQSGEPTYAEKLSVEDRHLDFAEPALQCLRRVRVGRAWTTFRGQRLLVHRAELVPGAGLGAPGELRGATVATSDGGLRLLAVQLAGRQAVDFPAFERGMRPRAGELLGGPAGTGSGR